MLIEPTWALLDTFDGMSVPLTIFCDVACVWRYGENADDE